jgi:hypothetical protein
VTPAARAIPSDLAREAAAALDQLLRARAPTEALGDAFFDQDWEPLWQELVAAGWTTLGASDDLELLDLTLVAETWGAHLVPLPLLETIAVRAADRDVAGRRRTYAVRAPAGWLIPFGESSEIASHDEVAPVLPAAGVRHVDRFARSLPITVAGAALPELPSERRAGAAVLLAASAVGSAASALAKSVEYARVREQFGRPIGSFQAVKHRLADMHARTELGRSALAWACAEPAAPGRATEAAIGLALRVAEDAIQVHGGIGFTWEASLHHHLRHVMAVHRLTAALA